MTTSSASNQHDPLSTTHDPRQGRQRFSLMTPKVGRLHNQALLWVIHAGKPTSDRNSVMPPTKGLGKSYYPLQY